MGNKMRRSVVVGVAAAVAAVTFAPAVQAARLIPLPDKTRSADITYAALWKNALPTVCRDDASNCPTRKTRLVLQGAAVCGVLPRVKVVDYADGVATVRLRYRRDHSCTEVNTVEAVAVMPDGVRSVVDAKTGAVLTDRIFSAR